MFPPIPPYSGLHVLVIHFPIALLIVAPVFVILGLLAHRHRQFWAMAALTLMVLGTTAAFVATATGAAAEEGADLPDGIGPVLEQHEHLAELARNLFTGLTVAYGGFVAWNHWRTPLRFRWFTLSTMLFLMAYSASLLVLANAAHDGGRLVHEFGVKSATAESASTQPG